MITVESLTRRYAGFAAVDNVSFTAQPGRVTGFLGPNGAGKSTTMRVMVGLTVPTSGSATINGKRLAATAVEQTDRASMATTSRRTCDSSTMGGEPDVIVFFRGRQS